VDSRSDERKLAPGEPGPATEQRRTALERSHDPARVLALSDGVFAIVMTLLVLDVHVPDVSGGMSAQAVLNEIRPSLAAFVVSFILAAMYWVGHRDLFGMIRRADRLLVWLNVLYLLPACLLPFAASLLGRYNMEPAALRIYGLVLLAIALVRVGTWLYVTGHPHLLWQRPDRRVRRAGLAVGAAPGLIAIGAIAVAAMAPLVSLLIYAALPLLYFLSITLLRSDKRRDREFADFT
jgi:uncharacterized membrane protein